MISALIAIIAVGLILVGSEYLWRTKRLNSESARKLIHVLAGSIAASLPFWLSYNWIAVCGFGVICLSLINSRYHFFKAGLSVNRRTYGDFLFAVAIFVSALIHPANWIFTVAILHVALGDGLAAIIGLHFSKKFYRILSHKKSVIGTITFALTSFLILLVAFTMNHAGDSYNVLPAILVIPPVAALLENVSGYGTDNITVPLSVMLLLAVFRI